VNTGGSACVSESAGAFRGSPGKRTLRTPAKINLGLRITGRREDGYHFLESVFAPIELFDEVEIELTPGANSVHFELLESASDLPYALRVGPEGPDNLVVRAAEAFRAATGLSGRIRLALRKSIPAGAGLGGGSSDAAAVLRGLHSILGTGPGGIKRLEAVALGLGADVPFFLNPQPALVTGIGEKIERIPKMRALDLVIANPGISVATADVYRVTDGLPDSLTASGAGSTMRAISRLSDETQDWVPALGDLLVNHLEPAAIRLCPPIGRLMERMWEVEAVGVSMSGSGGTVFGVFESAEQAERAAEYLRPAAGSESGRPNDESGSGLDQVWAHATRVNTLS
jgi:4-diphosphocytidyl-2-C-methyl-D-erythritol kinase